jgi:uncharacterized membrane protein
MSTWKYVQDGQQLGPVEAPALLALINNGSLSGEALVCKEGMADWVPARTMTEFEAPSSVTGTAPSPTADAGASPAGEAASDSADIEQNKVFAVLAYLGILFLVPLLAAPNSRYARYHTNQGIVLFIATVVLTGAFYVLAHIPVLGRVLGLGGTVTWIVAFVFMILGIINAAGGKRQPLPVLGGIQLLK